MVGMPIAPSGKPVSREQLIQHGMSMCQVPLDVGTFRKLKERCDGAKQNSFAIDVVFNPFVVKLFMDDDFCNAMDNFRPWLTNVAFNNIEKNLGVTLTRNEVKLVKSCRYKDGQGADGRIPRDFVDVVEDDEPPEPTRAPEVSPEPLIEEVSSTTGGRKKPAVKKGFFNNNKGKTLYPDEGSKEGVVHEDAGNPMGWIPKGLRNKSKIVDCNSPEYQEQERQRQAAQTHNEHVSEFNKMLSNDLGGHQRRQQLSKYDDEVPDGETDASRKYSNDYSRFAKIAAEEGEEEVEKRDWYIDSDGNRKEYSSTAATSSGGYPVAPGDEGAGAPKNTQGIKKGFFSDAKKDLYGPEGSSQGTIPKSMEEMLKADAAKEGFSKGDQSDMLKEFSKMMGNVSSKGDQSEMLKEFGKMMGNETDDPEKLAEMQRSLEQLMNYQNKTTGGDKQDAPKETQPKAAQHPVPEHSIVTSEDGTSLILSVEVPKLQSMEGVGLDVAEKSASLVFPFALSMGTLKTPLPQTVVPTKAKAKFSKKNHKILVTMPLA